MCMIIEWNEMKKQFWIRLDVEIFVLNCWLNIILFRNPSRTTQAVHSCFYFKLKYKPRYQINSIQSHFLVQVRVGMQMDEEFESILSLVSLEALQTVLVSTLQLSVPVNLSPVVASVPHSTPSRVVQMNVSYLMTTPLALTPTSTDPPSSQYG